MGPPWFVVAPPGEPRAAQHRPARAMPGLPRRAACATRAALTALAAAAAPGLLAAHVAAQPAAPGAARQVAPVLAFPEAGLDDTAAYQGYQTRLFRDAAGNTVQVYLDARQGRTVHVLADAENESAGFTARDAAGRPAALRWDGPTAGVSRRGRARVLEYRVSAPGPSVAVGQWVLGSMRVERDFQYERSQSRGNAAMAGPAYPVAEVDSLVAALGRLDPAERRRHLVLVRAPGRGRGAARRTRPPPRAPPGRRAPPRGSPHRSARGCAARCLPPLRAPRGATRRASSARSPSGRARSTWRRWGARP